MRVLLIKTSSMGDVIHSFPALTDATRMIPGIQFDWVVETAFQDLPRLHAAVSEVIPVAVRTWRRQLSSMRTWRAFFNFYQALRMKRYDAVIDAQGLLKSALIARLAKGRRLGLDKHSAREPAAAFLYQKKIAVARDQHAILRTRQLFADALGYDLPDSAPDYDINRTQLEIPDTTQKYVVFFHGTTWETKHWPESHWVRLAQIVQQQGLQVRLAWGNAAEKARAERIAAASTGAEVLPALSLIQMASILAGATGVISVDTGLGHMAAALSVPAVSLYGPTNPKLCGALGVSQVHLAGQLPCAPCYKRVCQFREEQLEPPCLVSLSPEAVWMALQSVILSEAHYCPVN